MNPLFLEYPKCDTCRKAAKWLAENGIEAEHRHIAEHNPTEEELRLWVDKSKLPVSKFFNTSGKKYKELNLKETVKTASESELLHILASDGMLVKRPIIITENDVLVGFNADLWKETLKNR